MNGNVVGYSVELNGAERRLSVLDALDAVRASGSNSNAVVVAGSYLRLRRGRLPEEFIAVPHSNGRGILDVSKWRVISTALSGARNKLLLESDGKRYMLKFPDTKQNGAEIPSHVSEFVSCRIAKSLGYSVQAAWLARFRSMDAVLVRMFDKQIVHFTGFGSSTLSGENLVYDLDGLLEQIGGSRKFDGALARYIFSTFVLDSFICNLDRHPNNWGFFKMNGRYSPAPLIDLGSSLFSIDAGSLGDRRQIERRIELYGRSAIKYRGRRDGFRSILKEARRNCNVHLNAAVDDFKPKLARLELSCLNDVLQLNLKHRDYCREIAQFVDIQKGWFSAL
jgi:hypothetical protein